MLNNYSVLAQRKLISYKVKSAILTSSKIRAAFYENFRTPHIIVHLLKSYYNQVATITV